MHTDQLPLAATEYSIWSDSARTNFSGSTDGRPVEEYVSWEKRRVVSTARVRALP